ncbi:MAG: hypothetical protein M1402_03600 [Candidatus Thermoplasmatota archaeon]|nr:hypothetical protein [Candidatus Thermoplasmatota archaeon]
MHTKRDNSYGTVEMLREHLMENELVPVMAISTSNVVRPLTVSLLKRWIEEISLSRSMNVNPESHKIWKLSLKSKCFLNVALTPFHYIHRDVQNAGKGKGVKNNC